MKITNNNKLPEPIVKAIESHEHKGADYSASMLYKSPRMVQLGNRYKDKIEKDASDMIWSLFGTALHHIVEQGTGKNELSEQYMEVDIGGKKLSGSSDLLTKNDTGYTITDYKTLSVWAIIYMGSMEE